MAVRMKENYDKYRGTAENIISLLFLVVVLDPRYKMRYLKLCFDTIYNVETVQSLSSRWNQFFSVCMFATMSRVMANVTRLVCN